MSGNSQCKKAYLGHKVLHTVSYWKKLTKDKINKNTLGIMHLEPVKQINFHNYIFFLNKLLC